MNSVTRRGFLKILGIGSASLALSPKIFAINSKKEEIPLKEVLDENDNYSLVRFDPPIHYTESNVVILTVNFDSIVVQRGENVVVPNRFLEVANNAYSYSYRKVKEYRLKYPYSYIRKASENEYYDQQIKSALKEKK